MNNKILYDKITKILKGEDENYRETLENIKKELETEIITGGKINNSIKQAFKRLQKENDMRVRFQNVLKNKDNYYTITNSYFLVTYSGEKLPKELQPYIDNSKDDIYADFEYEKFKNTDKEINKVSMNFDDLLKVHKYNKLNKLVDRFTLSNGFTFNIQYLLDVLAFLNEKDLSKVTLEISLRNIHPMNIISENGKALLLPIRMEDEQVNEQLKLQEKIIKGE